MRAKPITFRFDCDNCNKELQVTHLRWHSLECKFCHSEILNYEIKLKTERRGK